MVAFHCDSRFVSRSSGGSAVASAAYLAGVRLRDERTGVIHNYTHKHDVIRSEIILPASASLAFQDRGTLWRAAEEAEKRKNSQVAFEVRFSLPRDLPLEAAISLAREVASKRFVSQGMIVDLNIHRPIARDGLPQPHAHLLMTTRHVSKAGFGAKGREWQPWRGRREFLHGLREGIAAQINVALERGGFDARVDHRRLSVPLHEAIREGAFEKAARSDRVPEPKLGQAACAKEARGIETERGKKLRQTKAHNARIQAIYAEISSFGTKAKAAFLHLRAKLGCALKAFEQWKERIREWVAEMKATISSAPKRTMDMDRAQVPVTEKSFDASEKQKPETDFQRRLAEIRAAKAGKSMKEVAEPDTDFQKQLAEIRARKQGMRKGQSQAQKF